ncbi:hypothetical protein EHQ91_17310 [Leptospira biflexa]|uniref:hypothetical protein n=1 Tax=Leptospira biflexa TaxID=172 RepID=UPI00109101A5|nr:hypothetical protein [Leptospira biflexa]TGM51768.1 hypothetical protein EHQ91_17310 [Leptospira biflexa]
MKRQASFGFILLFLLYLGCKSSLFGVCISADSFVNTSSVPPCHQTAADDSTEKDSCDCPIVFQSLQTVADSSPSLGKPLETVVIWNHLRSDPFSLSPYDTKQISFPKTKHPYSSYFPTRTIRLLI